MKEELIDPWSQAGAKSLEELIADYRDGKPSAVEILRSRLRDCKAAGAELGNLPLDELGISPELAAKILAFGESLRSVGDLMEGIEPAAPPKPKRRKGRQSWQSKSGPG